MRLLTFFLILFYSQLCAQSNNPPEWEEIQTGIDGISFSIPSIPIEIDSLQYRFYSLGGDTSVNYKIVILKNLPPANGQVYETIVEAIGTRDSVQMISADSILYQGKIILDGSFQTPTPNGSLHLMFFRYCYYNDKLICCIISAPISLYGDLVSKKIQFFNSLQL